MKVLLVNGSPHKEGCTYTALKEVEKTLNENGIDTEIFWLGTQPISGCIACGGCLKTGRCMIDDIVNKFIDKATDADGFVFGSPVHYAGISGFMSAFMDRVFFASRKTNVFKYKPATSITSARRGGTTAALDILNKYYGINEMPIITSTYWNMVHGTKPEEVVKDEEGMKTMRTLGHNMAYYLKCIEAGRNNGVLLPKIEEHKRTNFIK